jgi:murein DD-endopeptidase MepM/ murein hydrolase activator NlpD
MLRRALPSLFCAFALAAPAHSQDVFVPRELKAQPVHPLKEQKPEAKSEKPAEKPKEIVRRAEPVTANNVPTIKVEKATVANPPKDKKEKIVPPKEKADADIPTIKVEKVATAKEPSANKPVAKTETAPKPDPAKEKADKPAKNDNAVAKSDKATAKDPTASKALAKADAAKPEPVKEKSDKPSKSDSAVAKSDKAPLKEKEKSVPKSEGAKVETVTAKSEKADHPATVAASKTLRETNPAKDEQKVSKPEATKPEVLITKAEKPAPVKEKEKSPAKVQPTKSEAFIAKNEPAPPREGPSKLLPAKSEMVSVPSQKEPPQLIPAMSTSLDMGFTKIADGFDFPVGKPDAEGYYKARGFRPGGHVGEDWDGVRGGDTDLGDPIYSIGDGIVVFARDVHLGWGNVIIVRHAYRENGNVKYIDALYGHLQKMLVGRGSRVSRGQQIATMGTAHGQYDAHLHFEIRKNLEIGMSRSKFQKDFSNYYDPTQFINSHRHLSGGGANYKVAMNTFTHDWMYHFDKNRDFGPRKRNTSQSSAALRAALTSR